MQHFLAVSLPGSANVQRVCLFPLQLILFGLSNQLVVSYKEESTLAFKQLFVKDYGGEDVDDYSAAVYTQQDLYDSVSYVMEQVVPAHTPLAVRFEMGGTSCKSLFYMRPL